jgi:hypothetical protein
MVWIWRRATGIVAAIAIAACSSAPSPSEQSETAERAAMAPLKAAYPDVVMGFDINGPAVNIAIDLNGLISMDQDAEDAMKAKAVSQWRAAWLASHPHEHAKLTIRLIDFKGFPEFTQTTNT